MIQANHSNKNLQRINRQGLFTTELLVAATLLVTLLSVVLPLAVKADRLRQDARHYRLALDELTNQLDSLASLRSPELKASLANLVPSTEIGTVLVEPKLSGVQVSDKDGTRIVLSLEWNQGRPSKPVTLVGWIASEDTPGGNVP